MFTGIITHLGLIQSITRDDNKDLLLKVLTKHNIERTLEIGCSIAINGVCLTLTKKEIPDITDHLTLFFQASDETCQKTTLKNWQKNQEVNLEFALRMGDELGGHMVLGHVDATANINAITTIKDSHQFTFEAPENLMKFIVEKGSVTLDGTSLTVNEVTKNSFNVNIIEHTIKNTIFKNAAIGSFVNLEIDALARYTVNYAAKNLKND